MESGRSTALAPTRIKVAIEGGVLAGWHWANPDKPPLLFCHATGFCASAYKQMLQQLSSDFDVYAIDMRGHGRTALAADPRRLKSWDIYARDIAQFLDRQRREKWILAGHSMGAVTATIASVGRTDIAALKLIEPVAVPRLIAFAASTPFWGILASRTPMARQAARRRNLWRDRAAAEAAYGRKKIFSTWAEGVLADYLEDGLCADGNDMRLTCSPAWEAATFSALASRFWRSAACAPAAISVLAADHSSSTLWPAARRRFQRIGAELKLVKGVSHLAPMENPQLAAQFILNARFDA